jgi:hypothetical protein
MGNQSKVITDALDALDKENKSEEGLFIIKNCMSANLILSLIQKYRAFAAKAQEQLAVIVSGVEKTDKVKVNKEVEEAKTDVMNLLKDFIEVKETAMNTRIYEKRVAATAELIESSAGKDIINKDAKFDLKEEQKQIEILHEEIKETTRRLSEWEINASFSQYTEQLMGNDLFSLYPSILEKLNELINKHIVLSLYLLFLIDTVRSTVIMHSDRKRIYAATIRCSDRY